MIYAITIFIGFYILALTLIVQYGLYFQFRKERKYGAQKNKIDNREITVLIPFRNEEKRLGGLLESINNAERHPKRFIFINDHSDDNSSEFIRTKLKTKDYEILDLPDGVTGKKRALRYAAEHVDSDYTLTLDADVEFDADFFSELRTLGEADMYVLPAVMISKKWYEHLYEIDLILVTAANAGLAGLSRPIMASGANLLYKTETFNRVDNLESHIHMASGDDTYLLRDFRESKSDVRLHTSPSLAVRTETPQSFKEFIGQRLRWIGKTGDIKDNLSTALAILQAVLTVGFFGLLIWTFIGIDWTLALVLLGIKAFFDLVTFAIYFVRIRRGISMIFIPLYEILFPLYTILLVVLMFTYKPKWKGRDIYSK